MHCTISVKCFVRCTMSKEEAPGGGTRGFFGSFWGEQRWGGKPITGGAYHHWPAHEPGILPRVKPKWSYGASFISFVHRHIGYLKRSASCQAQAKVRCFLGRRSVSATRMPEFLFGLSSLPLLPVGLPLWRTRQHYRSLSGTRVSAGAVVVADGADAKLLSQSAPEESRDTPLEGLATSVPSGPDRAPRALTLLRWSQAR